MLFQYGLRDVDAPRSRLGSRARKRSNGLPSDAGYDLRQAAARTCGLGLPYPGDRDEALELRGTNALQSAGAQPPSPRGPRACSPPR
eukprot:7782422-Alexandrium_andersonii.AAC.1